MKTAGSAAGGPAAGRPRNAPGVPAFDLRAEYESIAQEVEPAVRRVLASGHYVGGVEVEGLEREFAAFCGAPLAVAVSSGTDALRFALMAAGLRPGDEVITSPFTFIGTTEAITQAGGRIVFADIEPGTFTLDPGLMERAITPRTRVLLPVHLYGQTADMTALNEIARRRGLTVIEDACQAHGAAQDGRLAGALGRAGAFSFYPTKNLGGGGEGGLVTTADPEVAGRIRRLRDHGQSAKYLHAEEGYNGRLDALQAAILRVKLHRLQAWNDRRRAIAGVYRTLLSRLEASGALRLPIERPGAHHVYHLFAVRIPEKSGGPAAAGEAPRDRVRAGLAEDGIETGIHYPVPLHTQPCYAGLGHPSDAFPESVRAAREVLTLPLHPHLRDAQVEQVASALERRMAAL